VIGAGSFATAIAIPGLVRAGFEPVVVASASGLSAESARRLFGFDAALARADELLERDDLDLVAIATRHDTHAELAARALDAGQAVYVEKPLALDWDQLALVREAQSRFGAPLLVGFNRRYAPLARELRRLHGPRLMAYRVNAGRMVRDHWLNDLAVGGGRLKGEGCHFIDFLCDQAGSDPLTAVAHGFPSDSQLPLSASDNFSVQITFADGGVGTVHYAADAPRGPGKERFEVSVPGAYAVVEDFGRGALWKGSKRVRLGGRRQDKGFGAHFDFLLEVASGRAEPPDPESFYLATLATLAAARSLETGRTEAVVEPAAEKRP
jgi:predicted dehydrogenase